MTDPESIVEGVARFFSRLPQVESVVLTGSQTAKTSDPLSDLDFCIYIKEEVPKNVRAEFIKSRSTRYEVDNRFWETGDEWLESDSEITVDVMFRTPSWLQDQLDRVLIKHIASTGYSTCFWHNVLISRIFFDRNGWFQRTQKNADQPYPEELRAAIVKKNHPILRQNISSYLNQMEKAWERKDWVSIHHRSAAFLASYFDILFAINRVPHPGEKRQLSIAEQRCPLRPPELRDQVEGFIRATNESMRKIKNRANTMLDGLDEILKQQRLIP